MCEVSFTGDHRNWPPCGIWLRSTGLQWPLRFDTMRSTHFIMSQRAGGSPLRDAATLISRRASAVWLSLQDQVQEPLRALN